VIRSNWNGRVLLRLKGDNLRGIDLSGAKLAGAALYAIEGIDPEATGDRIADIKRGKVSLSGANLRSADLSHAVFTDEVITNADLSDANLQGAIFARSHLIRTNLTGANLTNARLMNSAFSDCPTIGKAVGLDKMDHLGPSSLDHLTLRGALTAIPDRFLLGAGYSAVEIKDLRQLYHKTQAFYSCFISYARQDAKFANQLRTRLVNSGISCWQDTYDLKGGDYWRRQIADAIDKHDRLILACSRKSLNRPAVVAEIIEAIERERATGKQKLFPIRLDDYILSQRMEKMAKARVASGAWKEDWVTYVRAYHIPDFSRWANTRKFSEEFRKLLDALKNPGTRQAGAGEALPNKPLKRTVGRGRPPAA
jgi:hypothetical protein